MALSTWFWVERPAVSCGRDVLTSDGHGRPR